MPPSTVPYLSFLFGTWHAIFSFIYVVTELLKDNYSGVVIALQTVSFLVSSVFVFVAGTLPVQLVRPALNVAQCKDVGLLLVSSMLC